MKKTDLLVNDDFISDLLWENHRFAKPKTLKNSFWINTERQQHFYHYNHIKIHYRVIDPHQWTFSYQSLESQKWKAVLINDPTLKTIVYQNQIFNFTNQWAFPHYEDHLVGWAVEVLDLEFSEDFLNAKVHLKLLKPIWIKPVTNLKIIDWQVLDYQYLAPLDRQYFSDLINPILFYLKLFLIPESADPEHQLIAKYFQVVKQINAQDDQSYFYQLVATLDRFFGKWWVFNVPLIYCEPKLMWLSLYEHWFMRLKRCNQLLLKKILAIKNELKQIELQNEYLRWMQEFLNDEKQLNHKRQMIINHYYHKAFYHQNHDQEPDHDEQNDQGEQLMQLPQAVQDHIDNLEAEAKATKRYDSYYYVIQTIKSLPWTKTTPMNLPSVWMEKLNANHGGLDLIKDRLMGILAEIAHFQTLPDRLNHFKPLCFVGPPGVGKTTLAKAFANAAGFKFAKIACGTITNVNDLYGSMPVWNGARAGMIIKALKNVQANNPVILLDEIDKLNNQEVINACLDLLDPQNNHQFEDLFIQIPFNLKNVIFIATANDLTNLHPALVDRLEIIKIDHYDNEQILAICQNQLVKQVLELYNWNDDQDLINALKAQVVDLVANYPEQGLRTISNKLRLLCRELLKEKIFNNDQEMQN